jgi:TPR repeat protein
MIPEEASAEDALGAASRTIGQMPGDAVQSKFAQLQQIRKARTERQINRQQAETDSLDGDEAAYQAAGLMHEKSDLKNAAHWYRVAAKNDFPGASLKLAKVLAALAAEHHARGETHAEEALIEEASDWCVKACAAGEFVEGESEAFDLMEELNARLDPDCRRAEPGSGSPATAPCTHGGLKNVIAMPNQAMEEHLESCSSCKAEQAEQAARGASAPASR